MIIDLLTTYNAHLPGLPAAGRAGGVAVSTFGVEMIDKPGNMRIIVSAEVKDGFFVCPPRYLQSHIIASEATASTRAKTRTLASATKEVEAVVSFKALLQV